MTTENTTQDEVKTLPSKVVKAIKGLIEYFAPVILMALTLVIVGMVAAWVYDVHRCLVCFR